MNAKRGFLKSIKYVWSVSYTHLDVYKRQVVFGIRDKVKGRKNAIIGVPPIVCLLYTSYLLPASVKKHFSYFFVLSS